MKTTFIAILIIALSLGAFFLFAPDYQKDKLVGLVTAGTDERKCFNLYKEDFRDPSTAYLVDSYIWTREDELKYLPNNIAPVFEEHEAVLRVSAQAKNGFGAYGQVYLECPLKDGRFDRHTAAMWRISNL